jgi:hypothetical protein
VIFEEKLTKVPWHIAPIGLGVISISTVKSGFTITDIAIVVAHWPAVGVNVYTVVPAEAVLMTAGFHVPVIPLVDVPCNTPGVTPAQYGPKAVNVGVIILFTVTDIVVVVAHWPDAGVNVYVIVPAAAVFITAGLQVPVIPLTDVPGKVPGVAPTQYGPKAVKAGVALAFTVTDIVAVVAHKPVAGVNT